MYFNHSLVTPMNYICVMPNEFTRSHLFLVNFLTGISDGLVLPFIACIIAYPFFREPGLLFFTGFIVAFTGAVVFGLARYFGEREEIHHHHPQLAHEDAEREEALMRHIGIADELTEDMKNQMAAERSLWLQEVQENEMGWERQDKKRALTGAVHTGAGFLLGGILACAPVYILLIQEALYYLPVMIMLLLLLAFDVLKARVTGQKARRVMLQGFLKSAAAIVAAMFLAFFILTVNSR